MIDTEQRYSTKRVGIRLLAILVVLVAGPVFAGVDPCIDEDGDLWATSFAGCDSTGLLGEGDCADDDGAVNPGADEVCGDDTDNDCDGDVDFGLLIDDFGPPIEGFEATGSCSLSDPPGCMFVTEEPPVAPPGGCCLTAAHKECSDDNTEVVCVSNTEDGSFRMLETEGPPGDPSCFDGDDQDCDVFHDHEDPDCQGPEVCNGFDDDFNGEIDETFPLGDPCTVGVGACQRDGFFICDGAGGVRCSQTPGNPKSENTPGQLRCVDGADNDCDTLIDIADPDCQADELCDGIDNDGNDGIDEDFIAQLGMACSEGEGVCEEFGVFTCAANQLGVVCTVSANPAAAGAEAPGDGSCSDGLDNDCDGLVDGGDPGCSSANLAVVCALPVANNEDVDDDDDPDDDPIPPPLFPIEWTPETEAESGGSGGTSHLQQRGDATTGQSATSADAPRWRYPKSSTKTGRTTRSDGFGESGAVVSPWLKGSVGSPGSPFGSGPGADENECVGLHRVMYDVFGEDAFTEVTAEFLVLDELGNLLAVVPVEDGTLVDLESERDPEEWAWAPVGENRYRIAAPVPLLRIRARGPVNEAEAYCSHIPYLDIIRPDGQTVSGNDVSDKTNLVAAIPLVDPDTVTIEIDGVDILAPLGIDASIDFPGTHPGGVVNINGELVTISNIVVDVAASVDQPSANVVSLQLAGLDCGGHSLVVNGQRVPGVAPVDDSEACAPLDDDDPFVDDCNCDDLLDCGSMAVFEIRIDSPTEGLVTNVVPTPVLGEICHGKEILRASVNGAAVDVGNQSFEANGGECSEGTYKVPIDLALPETNLFAEAIGENQQLGTFDPGANRLIAGATDVEARRVFKTFIFGVGEAADLLQTTVAQPTRRVVTAEGNPVSEGALRHLEQELDWSYEWAETPNGPGLVGTAIVDAFVLGIEGEAMDQFLAGTCAELAQAVDDGLNALCLQTPDPQPFDSPCCDPDVTFNVIGCDGPDAPGFLDDFVCSVTTLDGAPPAGGQLKVEVVIPRIKFKINGKGSCHGGFLWGCNTDVDIDVEVTFPHPGDPGCNVGDPDVCADLTMPDDDCCIPEQPPNIIRLEMEERDFATADAPDVVAETCACVVGDADCEAACCDADEPGCIRGTIEKSGVIKILVTRGGISAGGWNTVVLGILAIVVGGLLFGPLGAVFGVAIAVILNVGLFAFSDLSGFSFTPDILAELNLESVPEEIMELVPDEAPYQAVGLQVDSQLSDVKINSAGIRVTTDLGLSIVQEDMSVEESVGFLRTQAPAPELPIDPGNMFIVFSDDMFNGIFAGITQQGLSSSEGCSGSLAEGSCCEGGDDFATVDDLFPSFPEDCADPTLLCCDDPDLLSGDVLADAAVIGFCLGLRAGDLPEPEAEALCEAFDNGDIVVQLSEAIAQATCHGVRGANCSTIPVSPIFDFGEKAICDAIPPLNIKASDPMLLCARTGIAPRFLIADDAETDPVEARLHINDLLASLVIDRNADGFDGGELPTVPFCTENGTDSDCSLLGICLDLNFVASMQLVEGAEGPELAFELGDPIEQPRPPGEVCVGGVDVQYNYDPNATDGAEGSDPIMDDFTDNAGDAVPVQAPENIKLGRLVTFENPELFSIKTGTEAGRCAINLETMCNTDADCLDTECILFQDYFGVRGSITADLP